MTNESTDSVQHVRSKKEHANVCTVVVEERGKRHWKVEHNNIRVAMPSFGKEVSGNSGVPVDPLERTQISTYFVDPWLLILV